MSTNPPATAAGLPRRCLVLARVGSLHIGVPVEWVASAAASGARLVALPRRQGAIAGLLPTPQGCVPVVDIARWVPLPDTPPSPELQLAEPQPCYLTLHQGRQRLALRVDELLGLRRVQAQQVQRLHHHDDPEELFDAVLPATDPNDPDAQPICLLEPQRLMQLLAIWSEDSPEAADTGPAAPGNTTAAAARGAQQPRVAIVKAGGQMLAVDMRHVAELMPMPALKTRLAPGGASAGFAAWRDGTLAVLHAGWALGLAATATPAPFALVLCDADGRAVALPVDELLGSEVVPLETVPADPDAAPWRGCRWMDGDEQVELLDAIALLGALPEADLARPSARRKAETNRHNDRPYLVLSAGRAVALPVDDVLAVMDVGALPDTQTTLIWRQHQVPLHTPAGTAGGTLVAMLEHNGELTATRIDRLIGLVPAGAAEMRNLPGLAGLQGVQMLYLPAQAASYAILRAGDLLAPAGAPAALAAA